MATSLKNKMKTLPAKRRQRVNTRASQLIAEELSLKELRKARQLTQERMAELLQIRQENVSRLEKRSDLLVSTLRSYIEAMGGNLKVIVEFPDQPPVEIDGLFTTEKVAKTG